MGIVEDKKRKDNRRKRNYKRTSKGKMEKSNDRGRTGKNKRKGYGRKKKKGKERLPKKIGNK